MSTLTAVLHRRTEDALTSLHAAHGDDDLHLVGIRLGELESLARTAHDHDIDIPALAPYRPTPR